MYYGIYSTELARFTMWRVTQGRGGEVAQWRDNRNFSLREAGFESCLAISNFGFTLCCSGSFNCMNEYLAIVSGGQSCTNSLPALFTTWLVQPRCSVEQRSKHLLSYSGQTFLIEHPIDAFGNNSIKEDQSYANSHHYLYPCKRQYS